jgi:hypothetical protein
MVRPRGSGRSGCRTSADRLVGMQQSTASSARLAAAGAAARHSPRASNGLRIANSIVA